MTRITEKKIDELAQLARLEFNESEKAKIQQNLERILDFCEKLNEVDTEGAEPLIYLSSHRNLLREDEIKDPLNHDFAMKNAPDADSDYFRVPKFIRK